MDSRLLAYAALGIFALAWIATLVYILTGNGPMLVTGHRGYYILLWIFAIGTLVGIAAVIHAAESQRGMSLASIGFLCNAVCLIEPIISRALVDAQP